VDYVARANARNAAGRHISEKDCNGRHARELLFRMPGNRNGGVAVSGCVRAAQRTATAPAGSTTGRMLTVCADGSQSKSIAVPPSAT
jgi:hypothetical protein